MYNSHSGILLGGSKQFISLNISSYGLHHVRNLALVVKPNVLQDRNYGTNYHWTLGKHRQLPYLKLSSRLIFLKTRFQFLSIGT